VVKVRCSYCGSTWNIENEHMQARSKGGTVTVPACQRCNRIKQDKSISQFLDYIKSNDPYRWRKIVNYQKGRRSDIAKMVRRRRNQ